MNKVKIALLALVAVLLVVQIIDRSREPAQMGELKLSIDRLNATLANAPVSLRPPVEAAPGGTVVGGDDEAAVPPPVLKAPRDGNPKLDVNFLIPVDRTTFRPDWQGGTLRIFNTTPKGLNPLTDNSAIKTQVYGLCHDSLCDRPASSPEAWSESLAESLIISDDYRTYTFTLRKGVMWQRPMLAKQPAYAWLDRDVELTADDFKFAMDMTMDANVDCPSLRNYYEDFTSAEVVDRHTFRMRWKRKVYTSLSMSMGLSPIPRHIYGRNADGSEIPAGTLGVVFNKHWFDEQNGVAGVGAYRLEEYRPDERMVFQRNPGFWGVPQHFERIEWNLQVKQDDPQLIAFKNGQVHSHGLTPLKYKSEILDHAEKRFVALDPENPKAGRSGELGWERVKGMSFSYLGWNMRKPPFDDRRVRQAMSHAFPKQRIIDDVFYGLGLPVLSDVLLDSQYCNRDLKPYAFDLERAKALLGEAGWTDSDGDGVLDRQINGERKPFAFEVKYFQNSPEWDNALAIYRKELQKLGVDMKAVPYEFKELMRIYEDKDFNAVVGGWQMDWDIDYFQLWHSSQVELQGSSNHCGFANKRVDELADQLRLTFPVAERVAIAKEIQAIIHEEQPYTFFRSGVGIFVWQNRPAPGQPVPADRYLAGVIKGLDSFHPLVNRTRTFWHFRK